MAFSITDSLLDQLVSSLVQALWNRPELSRLREPIEATLQGNEFKQLAREAFQSLADHTTTTLPEFFDTGFITMPAVQQHLVEYVVNGQAVDVEQLAALYAKRLSPTSVPSDVQALLQGYLVQLRETLATHPTYGPILLARDVQAIFSALLNFRYETRDSLAALSTQINDLLNQLRQEPAIQAALERKVAGGHVFLSYSRANLAFALNLKAVLESAGHAVWMDTSEIKGGDEWIDAITDGVNRCYAMLSLVSSAANASKWVRREYLFAENKNKPIIPVWVEVCELPIYMVTLNALQGYAPYYEATVQTILRTLPSPPKSATRAVLLPPLDARTLELRYLDRLWLENKIWLETYTPMAGVARMRLNPHKREIKRTATDIKPAFNFREAVRETFAERPELIQQSFEDITAAVQQVRHLVVLGEPGAGKTTTLWKLAADYAQTAKDDPNAPLPVLLKLGALSPAVSVREQLQVQLGEVSLATLLHGKRVALLIDALNELPAEGRAEKVTQVRELVNLALQEDFIAVVTCRELDYQGELDLGIPEQVHIAPLDPARILAFCQHHLPDDGEALFWEITGGKPVQTAWQKWRVAGATWEMFWTADDIPRENPDVFNKTLQEDDDAWRLARSNRSLIQLARNPYMLFMMTEVYAETTTLPRNRGKLFELFTNFLLLEREHLPPAEADHLRDQLATLAFTMQQDQLGTNITHDMAMQQLGDERLLHRAISANLLDGTDEIRFTHQLLQEFFAARKMNTEMQKGVPATHFWPDAKWWEPQGWEETAILLAGLYSDDCTPALKWLCEANPELTWRCINESGAHTPQATFEDLQRLWLPRLTNLKRDPEAKARAAVGRVLGYLKLDDRKGVGLTAAGLPDFDWIPLPGGTFELGGDKDAYQPLESMKMKLDAFAIARYPVTWEQYQAFVDAPDGYQNTVWWSYSQEATAWRNKNPQPQAAYWPIVNHPRENVTWYEAVAFCRWVSAKLGYEVRLPTELEWERAARGGEKRLFAYGNAFDPTKANVSDTGLDQTSAVGIFPQGATPEGICDLTGNVWEWTLTDFNNINNNNIEGSPRRVLRGGSWDYGAQFARAASRYFWYPFGGDFVIGFRVMFVPPS